MTKPERRYLDHAATTPMRGVARAAVADAMLRWANPSSPHAEGRAARAAFEAARGVVAAAYGWPHAVIITGGASESLAIALGRSVAARRIVSAVEHDAVLRAAGEATMVPVDADGIVRADALEAVLEGPDRAPGRAPGRAIVAVQWANSETGVRQPIAAIGERVHRAGGLLLVDASQMPAQVDPDLIAQADLVALSAHKRGGPPGVGALLVRDLAMLSPSGGQERGYRMGTENLPGLAGYAAALGEPEDMAAMTVLRARMDDAIRRSGGVVVADRASRHPAIGAYRMPGTSAAAQLIRLDLAGIAVSAGSACSSGSMKPSHVLAAMGWADGDGREVVRVSFGRDTTAEDADAFVREWRAIARATGRFAA